MNMLTLTTLKYMEYLKIQIQKTILLFFKVYAVVISIVINVLKSIQRLSINGVNYVKLKI
jgi:hypothetical protein